jgi:hypothetical protein
MESPFAGSFYFREITLDTIRSIQYQEAKHQYLPVLSSYDFQPSDNTLKFADSIEKIIVV